MVPEETVSAVVIARNRRDALTLVLDRLEVLPLREVVVVDNGSEDGTPDVARSRRRVRLFEAGENLGLAARNLGAREAVGDLLLMLDDDSYPLPGAVETLTEAFAHQPRLGAAGGLVRDVDANGRLLFERELGTFDWWLRAGRTGDPREGFPAFFFPEGACMIRRSAYLEAGGFFEPYFVGSSEIDLTTRLVGLDWDVRYFPTAVFEHIKAAQERSLERTLYFRIRNHLWYLWLRFPLRMAVPRIIGYLAFDLAQALSLGVPRVWLRAVRDAWRGRRGVAQARRPLPRSALRRAELNRGRMHMRLLVAHLRRRLRAAP